MADYRRARWGLRRTFQTEKAIEQLSVFDNVAMIHEHSGAKRADPPSRRAGRDRLRRARGAAEDEGRDARRARAAARRGRARRRRQPRVVLLDEPAAGLPDEETEHLGAMIQQDPGAVRRARDPRRPRHEPRVRVLRDDRGARLRQADRLRADGRGAARRARDARLPGHRGGAVSESGDGAGSDSTTLSVARGGRPVVHDVSLEIPPGQVTTLLGANGAGKSTLVLAVGGLLRPSGGRGPARRPRPHRPAGPSRCARPASRSSPRDGGCCRTHGRGQPPRRDLRAQPRRGARAAIAYALELFPELEKRVDRRRPAALGRRAADGRARPGARLAAEDPARRRALARARAGRRQAARADARGRRRERASASC